jgi:hypothetical protein
MGTTMNHIAAVTVPFAGAWLWQKSNNYQLPFWVGVFVAAIALVANHWLPHGPAPKRETDEAAAADRITLNGPCAKIRGSGHDVKIALFSDITATERLKPCSPFWTPRAGRRVVRFALGDLIGGGPARTSD